MSSVLNPNFDYKVDFTFTPSIGNLKKFAVIGKNIIEFFWPDDDDLAFQVEVCLVEALSNVLFHSNLNGRNKISFQIRNNSRKLTIRVFDHGEGFSLPEFFQKKTNLYQANGRGLHLIRGFTDDMKYIRGKTRNELFLEKLIFKNKSEKNYE